MTGLIKHPVCAEIVGFCSQALHLVLQICQSVQVTSQSVCVYVLASVMQCADNRKQVLLQARHLYSLPVAEASQLIANMFKCRM